MTVKHTLSGLMVTGVLLLVFYVSLPSLAAMLVSTRLAGAGYSNNQIHISALGLNSARLDSALFEADDGSLRITMQDLAVTWSLAELFDGHVKSIELASLSLVIQPASGSGQGVNIPAPAALLALIPAERVRVNQIYIDFPQRQPLQQISGRLDYEHGLLQAPLLLDTGVQQFQLQAEIKQDGGLRVALEQPVQGGNTEIASLTGTLSRQKDALLFAGKLRVEYARLWQLAGAWLPGNKISGSLDTDLKLAWPAELPSNGWDLFSAVAGEASLTTDFMADQWGETRKISLHGALSLGISDGRCDWHIDKGLKAAAYWPGMVEPVSLMLPSGLGGSVARIEQRLLFVLPAQQLLRFGKVKYGTLSLPETDLRLDQALQLSYQAASGWRIESAALSLPKQALQWDGIGLTHQGLMLAVNKDASWRLRLNSAIVTTGTTVARAVDMDANLSFASDRIAVRYSLAGQDGLLHLSGRAEHLLDAGSGSMTWSVPVMAFSNSHRLSGWLKLQQDIDLDAGQLSISTTSRWQRRGPAYRLNHHIETDLQDVSGHLGANRFAGLSMRLLLDGDDVLKSSKPARIELASFDNGVSIRKLAAAMAVELPLQGRKPALALTDFSASLLGGRVFSPDILLDFNRMSNPFTLSVEHVDVEQILALERQEGLYGSGLLDGTIPLLLTQAGISVNQGRLSARPPGGGIRYIGNATAHALAASSMDVKTILGIFSDFHYDRMDVRADYASDGQLMMQVHLAGKNPAYANGRAVEFNLGFEENVLTLLESLRVAGDISKKVDERVQKRLKK